MVKNTQTVHNALNTPYFFLLHRKILGYNIQLQYFENQAKYLPRAVPEVNLMFLFLSYFKLLVILASSSKSYFPSK